MNEKLKIVYKKCGQTPLDCINEIKKENQELLHLPLTYAGRLDPLAEGVLIILIGDECLKKDEYLKLGKVYETTIIFGFETDTYDLMGMVNEETASSTPTKESFDFSQSDSFIRPAENWTTDFVLLKAKTKEVFETVWPSFLKNLARRPEDLSNISFGEALNKILLQFIGRFKQSYPPYSSRTVNGKPLYKWAREGKLDEITIPSHDVFVENIEVLKEGFLSGENFLRKIKKDIALVGGDFRQKEIIDLWEKTLKDKKDEQYKTITLKISCGSGVYVRGIAHELGVSLGVPAIALDIIRTKIGEYEINK